MDTSTGKQIKSSIDALVIEMRHIRKLLEKIAGVPQEPLPRTSEILDPIARLEELL